jgi:hypothetical protein
MASFTDIMQDRTHKVRRTLMAICLILIAIYLLHNLDFSQLALFGIRPQNGGHTARHLVLWTLWVLWAYHAVLFLYYIQRDWKDWRSELRGEGDGAFPELRMYFGLHPGEATTRKRIRDVETWKWSRGKGPNVEWNCDYTAKPNDSATATFFSVPWDKARSVRSRIVWGFALIDVGPPLALSIVALYLAHPITQVASCVTSPHCPLLFGLWY